MARFDHPLDADEFFAGVVIPRVEFYFTLDQVAAILGTSLDWVKSNLDDVARGRGSRSRYLRAVDLTPDERYRSYRVGEDELRRFLSARKIPYENGR